MFTMQSYLLPCFLCVSRIFHFFFFSFRARLFLFFRARSEKLKNHWKAWPSMFWNTFLFYNIIVHTHVQHLTQKNWTRFYSVFDEIGHSFPFWLSKEHNGSLRKYTSNFYERRRKLLVTYALHVSVTKKYTFLLDPRSFFTQFFTWHVKTQHNFCFRLENRVKHVFNMFSHLPSHIYAFVQHCVLVEARIFYQYLSESGTFSCMPSKLPKTPRNTYSATMRHLFLNSLLCHCAYVVKKCTPACLLGAFFRWTRSRGIFFGKIRLPLEKLMQCAS